MRSFWEDIQEHGVNKQEWLETFLELSFGIPSPDTFRRIFEKINPKQFEQCFRSWVQSLIEKLGVCDRLIARPAWQETQTPEILEAIVLMLYLIVANRQGQF